MLNKLQELHFWLSEDPKDEGLSKFFCPLLLGFNAILVSYLIYNPAREMIAKIIDLELGAVVIILAIIGSVLTAALKITLKIIEIITDKKFRLPPRYKLVLSFLGVPAVLLAHHFIVIPLNKNYEQKIASNN